MSHRDDQLAQLRTIAEELTGTSWPAYPDPVVIEGQVDPEVHEPEPSDDPPAPAPAPVGNMWEAWEVRRAEIALIAFDKGAWADLQEGKVEALANRVAKLARDIEEWGLPGPAEHKLHPVKIDADIAERYGVHRMITGYFDDTVRSTPIPLTEYDMQSTRQRAEYLRNLDTPASGKVAGGKSRPGSLARLMDVKPDTEYEADAARFERLPPARPELTVDQQFWGPVEKKPRQRRRHFGRRGERRHG